MGFPEAFSNIGMVLGGLAALALILFAGHSCQVAHVTDQENCINHGGSWILVDKQSDDNRHADYECRMPQ